MDGRILDENLKRMGLNIEWLQKRLVEQGYKSAEEVFLGICGENHLLTLFRGRGVIRSRRQANPGRRLMAIFHYH